MPPAELSGKKKEDRPAGGPIRCPACRFRKAYRLSDGRRKCRRCGRKYTPKSRTARLPPGTLRQIALLFWHMAPAGQAAKDLNLNRKTVTRHYRRIRRAIGILGERACGKGSLSGRPDARRRAPPPEEVGTTPLAGLIFEANRVRVILYPEKGEMEPGGTMAALLYARTAQAFEDGDLGDWMISLTPTTAETGQAENVLKFWRFTKRLGGLYGGRYREHFSLFMREAEYRFNERDNPQVVSALLRTLKKSVP